MSNCPVCDHAVIPNEVIDVRGDQQIGFTAWIKFSVPIEITDMEARILKCLIAGPLENCAMTERIYLDRDVLPEFPDRSVDVMVSKLRAKLEPNGWMIHHHRRRKHGTGSFGIYALKRFGESANPVWDPAL